MPILVNRNTTQSPMSATGLTGRQVVKWIPASRIYVKTADSVDAAPVQNYFNLSNGTTPNGWTDLGTVNQPGIKLVTDSKVVQVTTGPLSALRSAYYSNKGMHATFELSQVDDILISILTGNTPTTLSNNAGVYWDIGSEGVVQMAILIVAQDMLTGKEFQLYNPNAYMTFGFGDDTDGSLALSVEAYFPYFTPQGASVECQLLQTIFAVSGSSTSVGPISGSYTQSFTNAVSVIVPHNIGNLYVVPTVVNGSGQPMEYDNFRVIDANNALLTFDVAATGSITVAYSSSTMYQGNFTAVVSGAEYSATFTHNLNSESLGVVVFQNNLVVQTGNITFLNSNQLEVTFAQPITGTVLIYPT